MKKILFISVFMILSAVGMAQLTGTYLKVYSKTTPVGRSLPDSTVIFVKNQAAFYMTTQPMTATQTVQYMIDSSFILTIASGTSSATIADMSVTRVTASTATVSTLVNTNATVTNLTVSTATITTGIVTDLTATTATVTTLAVTGEASTKTLTTTGPVTASGDVTGGNLITGGNLSVSGTAGTGTMTVNGDISATGRITATGGITSTGTALFDSSGYFGDEYTKNWNRWFYPQIGIPASRIVLENLSDLYIQNKAGTGQIQFGKRDTTGDNSVLNLLNLGTVTAGGSISGVGVNVNTSDTITDATVGTFCYRAADSTVWLKINMVGPKSARWMKITVSK
jgi:hypothetical protein